MEPLTKSLSKDQQFIWTDEQERVSNDIKQKLCSHPILRYPDFTLSFSMRSSGADARKKRNSDCLRFQSVNIT